MKKKNVPVGEGSYGVVHEWNLKKKTEAETKKIAKDEHTHS